MNEINNILNNAFPTPTLDMYAERNKILDRMEMRKKVLAQKKEDTFVQNMRRKYKETDNKKYIHLQMGITGEGDYQPSDMGNEPPEIRINQ